MVRMSKPERRRHVNFKRPSAPGIKGPSQQTVEKTPCECYYWRPSRFGLYSEDIEVYRYVTSLKLRPIE